MANSPYLSLVVAARNDNHGGNMLGRMQAFLDAWMAQARRYGLSSEIVIVEWNPPADRPRLKEALCWPGDVPCDVRFVEVPVEVHTTFEHASAIPLHQMIAKNVGIRRARGEFVLVSNLDIIFSPAMMQFLASGQLQHGAMYRLNRLDIASNLPEGGGVDELLRFCERNVLRSFGREGGFGVDADGLLVPVDKDIFSPQSGFRLGPGWHDIERNDHDSYRWTDPEAEFHFERPRWAAPRLFMDIEAGPSAGEDPAELEIAGPSGEVLASASLRGRAMMRLHLPAELTSGVLRLRVRGRGLPLIRDPRILNLCVLGMEWEALPEWLQSNALPKERSSGREPEVRVLSTGARQIQLAVRPVPGEDLLSLGVNLTDAAGNTVMREVKQTSQGEHLVTLDFTFGLTGGPRAASAGVHEAGVHEAWLLETVGAKKPCDWPRSYHALHPEAGRIPRATYLHTHACGDFTLLARDDWFAMRAYPEWPIWPMHVDSLFCYAAYHAGIREEILRDPLRIYHIEHGTAAGWTPEGEQARAARLKAKGLSELQYFEVAKWINVMRRFNAPLIFTTGNWGLRDVALPEVSL